MMELLHAALWPLFFMAAITNLDALKLVEYDSLNLQITIEDVTKVLRLTRVNRVLANKFLPMWITKHKSCDTFVKSNVIDKLGEFSMYHDHCTKSAFVYFHDRNEIDGIIDVTFYVKRFPIDHTTKIQVIHPKYLHHIESNDALSKPVQSADDTIKYQIHSQDVRKVYLEVLVALSHDTYMNINQNSELSRGIATASHVLTVYNAVDMLYSALLSDDVQINIAGIVVESKPNQWGFESKGKDSTSYVDVDTIHSRISDYLWKNERFFPRKSLLDQKGEISLGQAMETTGEPMFRAYVRKNRFNAVVQDFPTYEHFSTIAHEIAHLFGAAHDGEGRFGRLFDVNTCGKSLMADTAHCTTTCLSWTKQTEAELAAFFRMPVYCNLKNYPRSLDVAKPKVIFSMQEQCECLGFEQNEELTYDISENDCKWPLPCVKDSDCRIVDVPLPMDGTPCGSKEVCWNHQCEAVAI